MSTNMNKSLDDIIKDRKQTGRNFARRGNGNFRRNGDNRRDRFEGDRRGIDRGFRGDRRGRGDRGYRGDRRVFRGERRAFRGDRGFRRDREDRDNFRRPRRSFDRKRKFSGDRSNGTRLFVNDLPKTVSNNDLRVLIFNFRKFLRLVVS